MERLAGRVTALSDCRTDEASDPQDETAHGLSCRLRDGLHVRVRLRFVLLEALFDDGVCLELDDEPPIVRFVREVDHAFEHRAVSEPVDERGFSSNPFGLSRRLEHGVCERGLDGDARVFDLIVVSTGVLESDGARPEKSFAELSPEAMARVYAANAIGPALVFKHFAPMLPAKERGVFAFLSARVGSIGDNRLGGWVSYRASKAALNQIVRCAAIELRRTRPDAIALALHPGTIDTALTKKYAGGRFTATPDECAENLLRVCAGATPESSGRFFAYDGAEIAW